MKASEVRNTFLDFFAGKQHEIVRSAPIVIKNDPTLMFTNAGMNQFKDVFLGNSPADNLRVADTQKCLRVSGKHNDLEEVGRDTYHHTMFEMLGNWSFGDYFKKEAIEWAWELLTEVYKIEKDRLYVTVFGGDQSDHLAADSESLDHWKSIVPEDRILYGSKKDNFWEMGDTGPCGPCSEIHVDIRDDSERKMTDGKTLVNKGHQHVIEIWNLVFIEFNRLADGKLKPLPSKHVDTGMGFERLCMVIQGKKSNYDTDVFQPLIAEISSLAKMKYGKDPNADVAMRVIADHLRAISFAIADGQLPSNNKAGYVIRRILRRSVRYGYTFLGFREPFIFELVDSLVKQMGEFFPELVSHKELIKQVVKEEELAFIRTLSTGISKFENYLGEKKGAGIIGGPFAFELFDTYGFPVDLTQLMAGEKNWKVDMDGFRASMEEQKKRSRQAAAVDHDDWAEVIKGSEKTEFVGYDHLECSAKLLKHRKIRTKDKEYYQIVLDKTPFYAESGGQVGDRGYLEAGNEKIAVEDTRKENNLIIHITKKLPADASSDIKAVVDKKLRQFTENNHTATHLLHAALKQVLGSHVEQKGSFVNDERLRFDFAHFTAVTHDELRKIEKIIFEKVSENLKVRPKENVPIEEAQKQGAVALFGEKYGDKVRVVTIGDDYSMELCGGTHVDYTGQIGLFLIVEESAIAAGMRRIEAITGETAFNYIQTRYIEPVEKIKSTMKRSYAELPDAVQTLLDQNTQLKKQIEIFQKEKALGLKDEIASKARKLADINFIAEKVDLDAAGVKDLAYEIKKGLDSLFLVLAYENAGKPGLAVMISDDLITGKGMNASDIVRQLAKEINGGGGGQPFYATAGGKNPDGIEAALKKSYDIASSIAKGK